MNILSNFSSFISGAQMDYLLANEFSMELLNTSTTAFTKHGTQVLIVNDDMKIRRWHDGDEENAAGWRTEREFKFISDLDEFDWMLALHVMNVVRLEDIAGKVPVGKKKHIASKVLEAILPD